ncbi:MAG: endoribonuclease MazF [Chloroflexi bacterium]|nr:MAG: endoribonuclease MazF [Chloroflexota bacterium]
MVAGRRQPDPDWSPDQGDIIYLDFDPQSGHEQAGRRPALVLSPRAYNSTASLALCCPLTTRVKGWPFEVDAETELAGAKGVVLADQVKALDWRARNADLAARAPKKVVAEVLAKLKVLLPGI